MKLFFASSLLFCSLSIHAQKIDNQKSKTTIEYEIRDELKRIQLKIDSSLSRKVDTTQRLAGVYLLTEKSKDKNLFDILTALAGILGLLTAIGGIIFTYRIFQKEKSNKQVEFLSEIDKMLIANPYLWLLYDTKKANFTLTGNAKITQQELDGQLEAFCYFHLNNFEFVFLYPAINKETRKTWKDYMIHLIVSSTRFRQLLIKESEGYIYNAPYRKKMIDFLAVANRIIPYYNQYVANSISRQEYYAAAIEILQ